MLLFPLSLFVFIHFRSPAPSRYSKSPNVSRKSRSSMPSASSPRSSHERAPSPAPGATGKGGVTFTESKMTIKTKLQLVDLAGSECVGKSRAFFFNHQNIF